MFEHLTGWHVAHGVLVLAWLGLVLAEVVLELASAGRERLQYAAAYFHYLIDLGFEIPLVVGVLATGIVLWLQVPTDPLLALKIALALSAIGLTFATNVLVIWRWRRAAHAEGAVDWARYARWFTRAIVIGLPLGLAALILGMRRAGWV